MAFAAASAALLALPGPTVTVVVGHAVSGGRRSALATVPGVVLGDFAAMTISLLGAGSVLAASATLFTALKLAGAAYLVWLGLGLIRRKTISIAPDACHPARSNRAIFWNCFLVTAFNPKDIVFFVAFLPQFLDPSRPMATQMVVLEATFLTMVGINILLWSLAAGQLKIFLSRPSHGTLLNRISGSILIGAGILTARA
nr:LysE family translocator [Roseibium litorale]